MGFAQLFLLIKWIALLITTYDFSTLTFTTSMYDREKTLSLQILDTPLNVSLRSREVFMYSRTYIETPSRKSQNTIRRLYL